MPADVIMPALGMAQETGKILRWLKADGDAVAKGEQLMEVETDKVTVEIEAPADGTLAGVRAQEGDDVPVGEVVAVVLAPGEELAAVVAETEPRLVREVEAVAASPVGIAQPSVGDGASRSQRLRRPLASPKARRLAQARGISIEALAGSGPNGAVVAADVEAAAAAPAGNGTAHTQTVPAATPAALTSVWRVMAERMTESWQTVPHFYLRRT